MSLPNRLNTRKTQYKFVAKTLESASFWNCLHIHTFLLPCSMSYNLNLLLYFKTTPWAKKQDKQISASLNTSDQVRSKKNIRMTKKLTAGSKYLTAWLKQDFCLFRLTLSPNRREADINPVRFERQSMSSVVREYLRSASVILLFWTDEACGGQTNSAQWPED